jgi:hypothetical protein
MARHGLRHTSKCSNFMLSMRWYLQKLHFNVYVYMATWVGHTLKKLLPPLLVHPIINESTHYKYTR